jgi:alkylated DNA repair dioxygenase AlkB
MVFTHCIVNRYTDCQGIPPHIDLADYGPVVACFTLGGEREMTFSKENNGQKLLKTANRSLYVMTAASRTEWQHEMVPQKLCNTIYSITFRTLSE